METFETVNISGINVRISTNGYGEKAARIDDFNGSSFTIEKSPMGDIFVKRNFDEPIDIHGTTSACVAVKDRRRGKVHDSEFSHHITSKAKMDDEHQQKILNFLSEFNF